MLPANLNDLTSDHIQGLIDSEVPESLTLEYKQELPTDQIDERRKFVCTIAAMANTAGGHVVFGIVDRDGDRNQSTGIPEKLSGMKVANQQVEIARLSNLIRDCIAPRLTGVTMQHVNCPNGDVLVLRVPRSWMKPHMVTMGEMNKFFGRAPTGKYAMSVDELRRAFSEQGELREAIAQWRAHRLSLIEKGRGPVPLSSTVAMLFHVIPAGAFATGEFTVVWRIPENEKRMVYVANGNYYQRYNADGFLCHSSNAIQSSAVISYTQLFRSTITEYMLCDFCHPTQYSQTPQIAGLGLEQEIVRCYEDAVGRLRRFGETGIAYVGFSMVGIEGKTFFVTPLSFHRGGQSPISQNVFVSPEVQIDLSESEESPYEKSLRPLVDTLWQLGGQEGTPFAPNGVWNPFRAYW